MTKMDSFHRSLKKISAVIWEGRSQAEFLNLADLLLGEVAAMISQKEEREGTFEYLFEQLYLITEILWQSNCYLPLLPLWNKRCIALALKLPKAEFYIWQFWLIFIKYSRWRHYPSHFGFKLDKVHPFEWGRHHLAVERLFAYHLFTEEAEFLLWQLSNPFVLGRESWSEGETESYPDLISIDNLVQRCWLWGIKLQHSVIQTIPPFARESVIRAYYSY